MSISIIKSCALILLLAVCHGARVPAQTPETSQKPGESIRVEIALVTVPVSIIDRSGQFVTGLKQTDFQLLEDGKVHDIAGFSATEEPFNVALLIDSSRSTRGLLGTIRKAARSFVDQLQPNDRVMIVTFDERVNFLGEFTSDRRQLQRSINSVKTSYLTSIYDAISRTITEKLAHLEGRKAIVVFSDGIDTWSKQANEKGTLDLVARSGVPVYAVQYNVPNIGGSPTAPFMLPRRYFSSSFMGTQDDRRQLEFSRYQIAAQFLRSVAQLSGGRHLAAEFIENSERAFSLIADELRHQYTLEYYSTNERLDGAYRAITVRLRKPGDFVIRARHGYLAPNAASRPAQ